MNILCQPSMTSFLTVEEKAALLDKMMDKFNAAADDYISKAHLAVNHVQLRRKFESDSSIILTRTMDEYTGINKYLSSHEKVSD